MTVAYYQDPGARPAKDAAPKMPRRSREEIAAEKSAKAALAPIIWNSGEAIGGTAAALYLNGRGNRPDALLYPDSPDGWPETLRYCRDLTRSPKPPCYAGMMAAVNDAATGLCVALQRFPLKGDGQSYWRPDGKKHKWSLGPIVGNAFRGSCWPDPQGRWGLCEGVETALSATQLLRFPCWAAISAGNMRMIRPPSWARHAYIFADHDAPNRDGIEVGIEAAARALAALRCVPHIETVRVIMAEALNSDLSDVLQELPYGRR